MMPGGLKVNALGACISLGRIFPIWIAVLLAKKKTPPQRDTPFESNVLQNNLDY